MDYFPASAYVFMTMVFMMMFACMLNLQTIGDHLKDLKEAQGEIRDLKVGRLIYQDMVEDYGPDEPEEECDHDDCDDHDDPYNLFQDTPWRNSHDE